ncbi:excinuclease ABC subunit UvrA [Lapidilactobacillus bayanensis]|uniref:excinuclease ABC subunit UvrA n=1 Tax=Lapidilactobacillus bayanensis TaxID=2485998 RepID=UPI000F76D397|nr:excinuclease ABC subunit UvrA [Lapidilactobacillus bayanensis]
MVQIKLPTQIEVRGGTANNLKNIDVNVPLNQFVTIAGVSGSGKSSLAMGILYAEGARRYLDSLATYTRRRISQVGRAQVRSVKYIPSALALRQRPAVPGVRSTVGTMTEIFNILRLIYSRLGSPQCPNGHQIPPTIAIAEAMDKVGTEMGQIICPTCGVQFQAFGVEDFAFNSDGACPTCQGLGITRQLDPTKLIDAPEKTIAEGAIAAWRIPGRNFMPSVAQAAGIRIDVAYQELTDQEKDFVLHGAKKQYAVDIPSKNGRVFHMDHALYENAYAAVEDSMSTTKSDLALKRLDRFYKFKTCPTCQGTRLNPSRLTQLVVGKNIAEAAALPLSALPQFINDIKNWLPANMQELATNLTNELSNQLQPLLELGLDYLTLDRTGASLSTGELQRIQLGRTLRTETTGVLYVLDEPSVGLHPDNVRGLIKIFRELIAQGNSLVVVDHETSLIAAADWVIEIGPHSGTAGGQVIAQGTPAEISRNKHSLIGPFLNGKAQLLVRQPASKNDLFQQGTLDLTVTKHFNLQQVHAQFPLGRLTSVTGFSGAGKTTLILDSLLPALAAQHHHVPLPDYVSQLAADAITKVVSVDASPVGKNTRSTVATYTNIMDELRKLFAAQPAAKAQHYSAKYFSYNNKEGACPTCGGTGEISLDIQYLPDMAETCPTCQGRRFKQTVLTVKWQQATIADVLALSVTDALTVFQSQPRILHTLKTLQSMGLGYLHLGEATPNLSGGEAQRLKLTTHLGQKQLNTLFVFDEPTIGLHPLDVHTLLKIFDQLLYRGATIITITHDLDLIANSDAIVDLGPRGGTAGGRIVATGRPTDLVKDPQSLTTTYLAKHWHHFMTN